MTVKMNQDGSVAITPYDCANMAIVNNEAVELIELFQEDNCLFLDDFANDLDGYIFVVINSSSLGQDEKDRRLHNLMDMKRFFKSLSTREVDSNYLVPIV